jgi:hypothetical protein
MQKIVINACYGGFNLSPEAIARYAELIGKKAYFFKLELQRGENGIITSREPVTTEEARKAFVFMAYAVPNPDEAITQACGGKLFADMTLEERKAYNEAYEKYLLTSDRKIARDDVNLIRVVEELGEKANGRCAKLKIVEIPDDVKWCISEYDGYESVDEVHRSWG